MKSEKTETTNTKVLFLDAKLPWEVARLLEAGARYIRARQVDVKDICLHFNNEVGIYSLHIYGLEDCWGRLQVKDSSVEVPSRG